MVKTPHWPGFIGKKPIDLGLERIDILCKNLGIEEEKLPPIIHVAGTNGKGSSIAFMQAIFNAAGLKSHSYTSPHLINFNERINLAGSEISDSYLFEVLEKTRLAARNIEITFFEGTTAAALLAFQETPADILLLETGLGGRLDATNIFKKPLLTAITPISFDHMEFLGNTIEKIAAEKAGIIKNNVATIIAKQPEPALKIFKEIAEKKSSELKIFGEYWKAYSDEQNMFFEYAGKKLALPLPALQGDYQIINAGTAIAAALTQQKFKISEENIKAGLLNAKWLGRLQKITSGKLKNLIEKNEFYIDGTHNSGGAEELKKFLNKQNKNFIGIIAMLKTKNIDEFFDKLAGSIPEIIAIEIPGEKCHEKDVIAETAKKFGAKASTSENIEKALETVALKNNRNPVIVTGSLYLAGYTLEQNQ